MNPDRPILVPIDFSSSTDSTLLHARMLATKFNAGLVLVHAIETHFSGFNVAELALHGDSRENAIYQLIETRLKKRITALSDAGFKAEFRIEFGGVHRTIASVAKDVNAAFIVVGAHGQSGFAEFLIGSNTFRVAASAPCPVITVRHGEVPLNPEYKVIVMPVDTSFYTRQKVKETALMAKQFGSKIYVFGVSSEDDADSIHHVEVIVKQVGEYLSANGIAFETNTEFGNNITDATILYAKAVHADLISIMTEQEPSIQSLIMGEFAQQMINKSPIPVLSYRPYHVSDVTGYSL